MKTLKIDFLYLDLNTCERCMATDSTLAEALLELSGVLATLGYKVQVNKVNITTRALAEQYRFFSSPTIRVNGVDICGNLTESNCCSCGEICGDDVDCRTFTYEGETFEQPPKAMLMDGILRAIYGQISQEENHYMLPDNLKRFFTGRESQVNSMKEGIVMKTMSIYEPAMCCPTGLCGVGVDPELLRVSTVLNTLKKKGIEVQRFNLTSAPQEFISNEAINAFLMTNGVDKLPAVVVDGEIIITGRYPTNEEFESLLGISTESPVDKIKAVKVTVKKPGGCGCSDGKCC